MYILCTPFLSKKFMLFSINKDYKFLLRQLAEQNEKTQISDKTLAKALDKNKPYNGHYYKSLGSKTLC